MQYQPQVADSVHGPHRDLIRGIEADVLPVCQRYGMGVIAWSPLGGGWLTGRYRKGQDIPTSHRAKRTPGRFDLSDPATSASSTPPTRSRCWPTRPACR